MQSPNSVKYDALTGMRAIAAIMLFVYHNRKYWRNDLPWPVMRFISEWHIGVTVFFVLSGFLLAYRYQDTPLENKKLSEIYFIKDCPNISVVLDLA